MKRLLKLGVAAFICLATISCKAPNEDQPPDNDQQPEQVKFGYTGTDSLSRNVDSSSQDFSMTITQGFELLSIKPELLAAADSLVEIQFVNFSDQKDEFKYNITSAPGTLVKIISSDNPSGTRTFQSISSVLKSNAKVEANAPKNTEVDEQVIDNSSKFELKFVIGDISLKKEERYQFLKQDILYSSIPDAAIDPKIVLAKLKLKGMDTDINKYWIITEVILQSYTYKKFKFEGKKGRISLPIGTSTVDSDNGTYKQMTDFKNKLVVRLVVRPAISFRGP